MKIIASLTFLITVIMALRLQAQDTTAMKSTTFQVSFVTPLGTNGLHSGMITNEISLNLLAGYAGGLNGVELSGLGSVLKGDMSGAQFSGLGSFVKGNMTGVQFSGLGSFVKGNMSGVQFSGIGSIVLKETHGVQLSGLFNFGQGKVKAAQFAGLANINTGKMKGFQASGLVNINTGKMKGFQASGLANINTDTMKGFQLTGLLNYASGFKLSQVSGLANIVSGNNKGFHLAGLININSGRLSGTQVAGLLNYTGKLNGAQFGVFNVVDSIENGVPIGFLSFVRNGYTAIEIGSTETLYGVVSFKTGTTKFYNILSAGGGYREGYSLFAWGYGLGAFIPLSRTTGLSIDGICYQVNEGEWFTQRLNLLNKMNIAASWQIAPHLSIFGGLSWNVTVSDITDEYGDPVAPHIAPYAIFDEVYDDHLNVKMYPGISAGIRL